ncbi:MAG: DUF4351 domain-containing protein [Scytonema sp. PMC 1069.18]|nr:DUF4351 domain-containing protein [Scytonema sp. PMC 1069.18]MEC4882778.1 DUF4351 domain-containing protein [Scytonema sp. PMC 1070.18]
MTDIRADYDKSWKEALNEYFEDFLAFFFPAVHAAIDWTQTPESLDKELQNITASAQAPDGVADKLYKVQLLDKKEAWILIHVEVQSYYDVDLEKRIYTYNYRAGELYDKFVVSLAVLGDTSPTWRPNRYAKSILDCSLSFTFPTVKLMDYEQRWHELESSNNPFAIITMAHLKTKATTRNLTQREEWKWQFIRGLYERGLTKQQIVKLFDVIDTMMTLPEQLQQRLFAKIDRFEEERKMALVSPTVQLARKQGEQKVIIRLLNLRLGEIEESLIEHIRKLPIEQLEELAEALLDFSTVAELEQWLQNRPVVIES